MSVAVFKLNDADGIAAQMRRLRAEAQMQARNHSLIFADALTQLEVLAADIASGGEAYPVGVREAARQLGADLVGVRMNVASILGRAA